MLSIYNAESYSLNLTLEKKLYIQGSLLLYFTSLVMKLLTQGMKTQSWILRLENTLMQV